MLELVTWVKDGPYRLRVLQLLSKKSYLPSELADELDVHRASMSRILSDLKEKNLISGVSCESRTVLYSITVTGLEVLKTLYEGDTHVV